MDETEARHRIRDLACAASLARDAAEGAPEATAPEATAPEATAPEATAPEAAAPDGPTVVHTPYGKALVYVDRHGADVQLPEGATVHVRFG